MVELEKNKVFVQIGTNNGDDEFNRLVRQYSPSKTILVEPNRELNNQIYKNYSRITNVYLQNVAITNTSEAIVKLVIPVNAANGVSVNGIHYTDMGYSLLPMDDWGNKFNSLMVQGMTFMELCEWHGITDIHYLQIDTEGYDAEIIKSIDFAKVNIDIIKYEQWNFSENCFTRHGEESKLYGINGMNCISDLLVSLDYELTKDGGDMIAVKNKLKIKPTMEIIEPAATHQLVLFEMIRRTQGGILELGAGDYSTRQIHEVAKGRRILTTDNDPIWLNRYNDIATDSHEFLLLNSKVIKQFYLNDIENWSVVFVDNDTWFNRIPAIMKYRNTAEYVIVHDAQRGVSEGYWGKTVKPMTNIDFGERDFSDIFKYWIEFLPVNWRMDHPTTVLGSNKHDLKDTQIIGMMILSRNK